jgi:calcium-dependent protein kinase
MDHPNIIRLYDIFDSRDFCYVITEYCDGRELFSAIKKNHHFSEKNAASIMKQLLSAVNYMHNKGIVHRDLKPENIVLESTTGSNI